MENLKIRVKDESESKEAQELFFELGFEWKYKNIGKRIHIDDSVGFLYADRDCITTGEKDYGLRYFEMNSNKQITLPELRDLVVLKRNDVGDATHTDESGCDYYQDSHGGFYYKTISNWKRTREIPECIKPIEKKTKEYLDPRNGYKLIEAPESEALEPHASEWVLVPEGAEVAYFFNGSDLKCKEDDIAFYKDDIGSIYYDDSWHKIDGEKVKDFVLSKGILLWQRQAQPEELPFIDDEPSINDQYAEIEKVRQATTETEYLMQGKNGEKLMESLAQFNNTDRGADFDSFEDADAFIESNVEQDSVNNPSHYNKGGIECIDAIRSSMTYEAFCGYLKGNVQKYMWRYENKGGTESLKKAQWYLSKLIEVRDETSSED